MLNLTRRPSESIVLEHNGTRITLIVEWVRGQIVKLSIDAPREVTIHRGEVQVRVDREANNAAT